MACGTSVCSALTACVGATKSYSVLWKKPQKSSYYSRKTGMLQLPPPQKASAPHYPKNRVGRDHQVQLPWHSEQVTQEYLHVGLGCLRSGRLHSLPGQLFQASATLNAKKILPHLEVEVLSFSFWPLLLVLSLGTNEKSLAPPTWHHL